MDSRRSERKTAMRRYTETEQRTRVFKIDDYSMQVEFLDAYRFIESATFTVSGHEWRIAFYPNGAKEGYEDHASVFLKMLSKLTDYRRVFFDFRVTNPATALSSLVFKDYAVFNSAMFC
jgi:speckle-type POZ protein